MYLGLLKKSAMLILQSKNWGREGGPMGSDGLVITVNVYDNFIYQLLLGRLLITGIEQEGTALQY